MSETRRFRLLYLVTEDWYFRSHRLPMARAARAAGFEVVVVCRVGQQRAAIEAEGFRVIPLDWQRRGNGLLATVGAIRAIFGIYRREQPDLVHHVAIKPVVLGGIAAWLAGVPAVINALTGLGFVFIGGGVLRLPVRALMRFVLHRPVSRLIVQNLDDRDLLVGRGFVPAERVTVIRGSGIDTEYYQPLSEPAGAVTVAYVGRMLEDKGVPVLIEAYRLLRARNIPVRLLLVGTPDPENPTSVLESTLRARVAALPGLEWRGAVEDVRTVWAEAHIAVLPSRREGLPKSLMEAAACGRPLVATDVPGCREIARAGENALTVPPDDPAALAAALEKLICDSSLRTRFGAASRRLVLSDLAVGPVGICTVGLYRACCGR
ncbi:MAG: glycosyltransferase family 4 protein [Rhodospirillaceae bacterium]